jgi:hypothetical protein
MLFMPAGPSCAHGEGIRAIEVEFPRAGYGRVAHWK